MTGTKLESTLKSLEDDLTRANLSDRKDAVLWLRSMIADAAPPRPQHEPDEEESDMDLLFDNVPL